MARDRDWRRWQADIKLEKSISVFNNKRRRYMWILFMSYPMTYQKKTSITETIDVTVITKSHYIDYVRHTAKLRRDNPKGCSCMYCCNPRNAGIGNSRKVLSHKESTALLSSVQDIADCEYAMPNSKWRSRKWKKSSHGIGY